jgi:predicted kinase
MTTNLHVLVLRGAPGVGKSTLGRGLRRALPCGAVIEVDDVRGMLSQVDWTDRHQHDIALAVGLDTACSFIEHGRRPVIVIDTFSRSRLRGVQARLDGASLRHHTLSLWLEASLLADRLKSRTSGFKDWEPSRILNDEVRANRYPAEQLVDVSALDREAVLGLALELLGEESESAA